MTGVVTNFVANTLARADQINAAFLQAFQAASVSSFSETVLSKTTASQWRVTVGAVGAPVAANDNEVALFDGGAGAMKSSGALWSSVARINISQAWTGTQNFTGAIVTVADQVPSANIAGSNAASNTRYIWDFFNYVVSVGGIVGVDSPAFTGNPTAPTPTAGDNDTSIATTAFVQTAINNRVPATNTQYGLIYGNGTGALAVTAAMTNGQVLVGQTSAAPLPKTVSGDATMAASGALTVTKSAGVSFGSAAFLDASAFETAGQQVGINTQTGTTYTLVLADKGKVVEMNNASANTLTVPPNSSVAFPVNSRIDLAQFGAGQTTIAAGAGVTIRSTGGQLKLTGQYSGATLYKRATDEWVLVGSLSS